MGVVGVLGPGGTLAATASAVCLAGVAPPIGAARFIATGGVSPSLSSLSTAPLQPSLSARCVPLDPLRLLPSRHNGATNPAENGLSTASLSAGQSQTDRNGARTILAALYILD